jgi:hypothetical protein
MITFEEDRREYGVTWEHNGETRSVEFRCYPNEVSVRVRMIFNDRVPASVLEVQVSRVFEEADDVLLYRAVRTASGGWEFHLKA